MAVRKQRSTTKDAILDTDIKIVIRKAKSYYKDYTNEFYIYEAREDSGYYFPEGHQLTNNYVQHWKLNVEKGRWECISDNMKG